MTTHTIPPFRLPASTGQTLERESFLGKVPLVVFFLVDIDSEADRTQLREYDDLHADFGSERVQVLGVAQATAREVRDLSGELDLTVPVLADAAGEMATMFGVLQPDGDVQRVTLLVDRSGRAIRRFDHAVPTGQAAAMLNAMRALKRGELSPSETDPPQEPSG